MEDKHRHSPGELSLVVRRLMHVTCGQRKCSFNFLLLALSRNVHYKSNIVKTWFGVKETKEVNKKQNIGVSFIAKSSLLAEREAMNPRVSS